MVRRFSRRPLNITHLDIEPIIQLWLLRILVPLGGYRQFVRTASFNNDRLAEVIGLGHWIHNDFDMKAILCELRLLHQKAEKKKAKAILPANLCKNIDRLSDMVNLSAIDRSILAFTICLHNERILDDATEELGQILSARVFSVLSVILDLPEVEIRASLSDQGILVRSGLISIDRRGPDMLRCKLDLLSNSFADLMVSTETNPINMLRGIVSAAGPGHLSLTDYSHINTALEMLLPYLRHATATKRCGVNIFLYGAPGTGKSQLARTLAKELGCELLEVASEDVDGDLVDGERRLRGFIVAQSFFAKGQALFVFDEAEDVFDGNIIFGRKSVMHTRKAFINRMLEENPVPTIWLSNHIKGLDTASIRRFDMVFELPVPPKKQREQILRMHCGDLLDATSISRIAEVQSLAPALVTKASSVVRLIRNELGPKGSAMAIERLISNALEAQGHQPLVEHDPNRLPEVYDPRFIHADADLNNIAAGLVVARTGRLCLYGPPGTGKTAYGRWMAEQIGIPLLVKRASDLISKWVGESERNIARAFRQAEQEGALLLIDEADSFLQDRRGAQHGWEVSLVNEMLTQIEAFAGLFIATTNLMAHLDQAVLRRFDLKVKFDFLRPKQAWELLCRYCEKLNLPAPQTDELLSRIMHQLQLTPGDFAAVLRQHRFRPITSASMLVSAVEVECAVKEGQKLSIGFI